MEEYAREPCPFRIVDDCGGAFAMGCIGGGIFQAIKGFRNAPSGMNKRLQFSKISCSLNTTEKEMQNISTV
ncbi:mitochondrial import inner membrane translocase subunit Tim17-A-like isoform X2 [Lucilia cuprina]|uniref:mitochondrial import inner membrane translocase subunit Tim17-A-like isoform X2 n=1 Tax=Lucilia cuprina TaxID=7375 RepID=UPI001F062E01|nr:mitochondrial import inner membrane translocase subunit Tim17-A-like isoform X2 [Lucilia cuprina]